MNSFDFALLCCKLFEKYPPYNYRNEHDSHAEKPLNILLLGSGKNLNDFLHEVLLSCMLLDTSLTVNIVSEDSDGAMETLSKEAPALKYFVKIQGRGKTLSDPEEPLCTLRFNSYPLSSDKILDLMSKKEQYSYIFLSEPDDELTGLLAKECCNSLENRGDKVLAYLKDRENGVIEVLSPQKEMIDLSNSRGSQEKQIGQIAFNVHYVYEKGKNDHTPLSEIERTFNEPYSRLSSVRAALHMRSKLLCCGITDSDASVCAQKLFDLIQSTPAIVDRLSALEHRRWMMEKLLAGYRPAQPEDYNCFYSKKGMTTHSESEKWHSCLVMCEKDGQSHLEERDWAAPADKCREELDPLDKMSLLIHEKCHEIAYAEEKRKEIEDLIEILNNSLDKQVFSKDVSDIVHLIKDSVSQMYAGKKSALAICKKALKELKGSINETPISALLSRQLDDLEWHLRPLEESILNRDYKEPDRALVRQIPFMLTHKKEITLVGLLGRSAKECLYAAWRTEPTRLIIVGYASDKRELEQLKENIDTIEDRLSSSNNLLGVQLRTYHIIIPSDVDPSTVFGHKQKEYTCEFHLIKTPSSDCVAAEMGNLLVTFNADYVDISGADPMLAYAAVLGLGANKGALFGIRNGTVIDLRGAKALEYAMPSKSMTVKELFLLNGAVNIDHHVFDMRYDIILMDALWDIVQEQLQADRKNNLWGSFCEDVFKDAFKDYSFGLPMTVTAGRHEALLKRICEKGIIKDYRDYSTNKQSRKISFRFASPDIMDCFQKSGTILEYYIYRSAMSAGYFDDVEMGWHFRHSAGDSADNEIDVICTKENVSLFISAKLRNRERLTKDNTFNYIIYEVSLLANRFGINAKPILVAPFIDQFETGMSIRYSKEVELAKRRGVYLLGREFFLQENVKNDALGEALKRIAEGRDDWCNNFLTRSL